MVVVVTTTTTTNIRPQANYRSEGEPMARMQSMTITIRRDTDDELIKGMNKIGEDPDARGAISRYIEDAILLKNGFVGAGKWIPSDMVDFRASKLTEKKAESK